MAKNEKRALVTGGARLIGSHVTDLLVREGWKVRVLDNLEPQTHRRDKPAWINPKVEFTHGDIRDRETIAAALDKIDVVRSEERRVGKECRSWWACAQYEEKS